MTLPGTQGGRRERQADLGMIGGGAVSTTWITVTMAALDMQPAFLPLPSRPSYSFRFATADVSTAASLFFFFFFFCILYSASGGLRMRKPASPGGW